MNMYMSGSMVHVGGAWTLDGITQLAIDSLIFTLQQIEVGNARRLLVDCRDVIAIDSTGQELLNVWMQCARLRGVEPELLNPPSKLRQVFQSFGLPCRNTSTKSSRYDHTTTNRWKRRFPHKHQRDQSNCQTTSH
jgi:anti-anti-sigma regulatory factor